MALAASLSTRSGEAAGSDGARLRMRRTAGALHRAVSLLLAFALAGLPWCAQAWGPVGHRAVGAIADALLDPQAKAAVAELLRSDRDREGRPSGRKSLASIADWADQIRGGPQDRPRWHFDNRPLCGGDRDMQSWSWCPQGACATAEIGRMLAILRDRSRPPAERETALKWIVHLAADIHQPLHEVDYAAGGNRIRVRLRGRHFRSARRDRHGKHDRLSLHAFWDSRVVALALHPEGNWIPRASLQRLIRSARAEDPRRVAEPPSEWGPESFALARTVALDLPGISCDAPPPRRTVTLSRAYVLRSEQVAEAQLALAGARLAYQLNGALAR